MAEVDLLTSSDESDEDYVPEGESSSEEPSSSDHSWDIPEDKGHKSRKRRKLSKKRTTKARVRNVKEEDNKKDDKKDKKDDKKDEKDEKDDKKDEKDEKDDKKDEKATHVDALWADFKEDVSKMEKQILSRQAKVDEKPNPDSSSEKPAETKNEPASTASGNKGRNLPSSMKRGNKPGLNKILEQLSKKDKTSTLAKTKQDWFNFKKSEGIEEEIKTHNKGKGGYLEKQDFLQRTDLRQFEIEKQLRASKKNQ